MASPTITSKRCECECECGTDETKLSCWDPKYLKRRKQKQQKLKHALWLLVLALVLLAFTKYALGGDSSDTLTAKERMEKLKRTKDVFQEGIENGKRRFRGAMEALEKRKKMRKNGNKEAPVMMKDHREDLKALDEAILTNADSGIQWINPEFLPSMVKERPLLGKIIDVIRDKNKDAITPRDFFHVRRFGTKFAWEDSVSSSSSKDEKQGPTVDFTKHSYDYPDKMSEPPAKLGDYPKLKPMKELMENWPQDDIDHPPTPLEEVLIHFDYNKEEDVEAARKFRDAKLPFKFINVPEVVAAGEKWTDEYVNRQFSGGQIGREYKRANGNCQESINNFFAFFNKDAWDIEEYGLAPTRNNDWSFEKWAEHAKYADAHGLSPNQPHFYWQAGVDKEERHMPESKWTFISKDLPSFSSPKETFFVFNPEAQKGIQCRFGERGVTAATHFDAGRNMIAMVTGAKRYILSPPRECSKLGIVPIRGNAMFRHSMLNYGHINYMDNPEIPDDEKEWLEVSSRAMALETVLKAGEVLYIPSHWFHYITSLQKSAQCNVRSGVDKEGDTYFGGLEDVSTLCDPAI
eukprot:scaffold2277_cov137-Cylindrotheca_fusiformis.AAC.4